MSLMNLNLSLNDFTPIPEREYPRFKKSGQNTPNEVGDIELTKLLAGDLKHSDNNSLKKVQTIASQEFERKSSLNLDIVIPRKTCSVKLSLSQQSREFLEVDDDLDNRKIKEVVKFSPVSNLSEKNDDQLSALNLNPIDVVKRTNSVDIVKPLKISNKTPTLSQQSRELQGIEEDAENSTDSKGSSVGTSPEDFKLTPVTTYSDTEVLGVFIFDK